MGDYAKQLIKNPPKKIEAALILSNRAHLNGKPNPCLTGLVEEELALAQQDLVSTPVMSGSLDDEDKRIKSLTMEGHARDKGFKGNLF